MQYTDFLLWQGFAMPQKARLLLRAWQLNKEAIFRWCGEAAPSKNWVLILMRSPKGKNFYF